MTSPASASFPWAQVPEPPSGEFRSGRLPAGIDGGYLAARGSRPGPALLILADPTSGYAAIHGLFHLADMLDARRLAGSLLVRLGPPGGGGSNFDLRDPAGALVSFVEVRPGWREHGLATYPATGIAEVDRISEQMALSSGAPYRSGSMTRGLPPTAAGPQRDLPAVAIRYPDEPDARSKAVEQVFQGLIDTLRVLGMLEGQPSPAASRAVHAPALAAAPASGFWSPAARPGQRLRIDDRLGSFHDSQGRELGDLLSNVSGIVLGISDQVWIEAGQPVAEVARPVG